MRMLSLNFMTSSINHLLSRLTFIGIVVTCSLVSTNLKAQEFPSRVWHEGRMVTTEKDTLRGKVMYNMETNTIQLQVSKKMLKSFSSKNIFFFEIYDKGVENYRRFYSIPYKVSQNYKTPIFFEVLYEGALTLLVREKIVLKRDPYASSYGGSGSATMEKLVYTYYFVDKKGNMKEYNSGKRNDLLMLFDKNSDMVKKFIKTNSLRTDRMRDLVRITAFYNSL